MNKIFFIKKKKLHNYIYILFINNRKKIFFILPHLVYVVEVITFFE